jgi:hypothetical protein
MTFKYIKDRYNGSPTNAGIINSYVNYIIGEGLIEISNFNINKYISKRDILICQDYKLYGQFTLQIIWSQGSKVLKKNLIRYNLNIYWKIGLNLDESGDINGYWYSFNWSQQTRYKPRLYQNLMEFIKIMLLNF